MRVIIFFTLFPAMLCAGRCRAQFQDDNFEQGFNATVAASKKFSEVASCMVNHATLGSITSFTAAAHTEKQYLLKELSTGAAVLAFPVAGGGAALAAGYAGAVGLNASRLSAAFGKNLGKAVSLGMAINYHLIHVAGYGNAAAVGFSVDFIVQATPSLETAIHVSDPVSSRYGHGSAEKLPARYSMSLAYQVSGQLLLMVETSKREGQSVEMLTAFHYAFMKAFFVRSGVSSAANSLFAGIGLCRDRIRLDFVANYHVQLGFTPGIQVVMGVQKKPV